MTVLKLQNEGQTLTLAITRCEVAQGQYGEQVRFSAGGDDLYLPRETADRQLGRCGFVVDDQGGPIIDYDAVVGNTLVFSRDHNPKPGAKPFWGISLASGAEKKPQPASKRVASPYADGPQHGPTRVPGGDEDFPPVPPELAEGEQLPHEAAYYALVERVTAVQAMLGSRYQTPFDMASVNAMAFSIWNTRR